MAFLVRILSISSILCLSQTKSPSPPSNIILILTDDQDKDLGSLQFMPNVAKYLGDGGASFQHGYVTTPMCCPSRSSLLTGLYVHNHNVYTNNNNCSSSYWQQNHEKKTFATYLQRKGYKTSYFGKYLNKYTGQHIPPGWDEWQGLVKNSRFYNYTLNSNGKLKYHGNNYEEDYLPDLITNKTLELIDTSAKSPSPFLAVLAYPGPHGPEDAAPQYQDMFLNVTTHHTPAYDFAPNPDKQWILRHTEKMLPIHRSFTDMLMSKRLQTLQSVDTAVEKIVKKLEDTGQLKNTYIFYTSDHGYHLGQFGLVKGKAFPFDFDTHVPFLVRGPGIPPRSVRNQPVLNVDLAPTFLDIAGLSKPPHMDGKSLLPTIANPQRKLRDAFLIERGKMSVERYAMVSKDKIKGTSAANLGAPTGDELSLKSRLVLKCAKERYQAPCKPTQKYVCRTMEDGSTKIGRCRSKVMRQDYCHCNPGQVFGWRYLNKNRKETKTRPKRVRKNSQGKNKGVLLTRKDRSIDINRDMWGQVLEDEMEDVDFLVEDIAMQLGDIETSKNDTVEADDRISRSKRHLEKPSTWASSRNTIKHQIQQLRAQLNELKQIRKYLKIKRPVMMQKPPRKKNMQFGSSIFKNNPGVGVCFCNSKKNKTARRLHLKVEMLERRRERKFERMIRKERRRKLMEKKKSMKMKKNGHCKTDVKMNCFSHDNNHWKSAPAWTEGPFCACTNSNNNTYWCVRNINVTHNYLYCEYVTGMITYFDLKVDPFQLRNLLYTLPSSDLNYMHGQVKRLKDYSGKDRFLKRKERRRLLKNKRRHRKLRKRISAY